MRKLPSLDSANTGLGAGGHRAGRPEGSILIESIPLSLIDIDSNVRSSYSDEAITELAASITLYGLLQPITLVQNVTRYTILAGHRRFLAAQRAGLDTIPAIVRVPPDSVESRRSLQLVENLQRENLSPLDVELAVTALLESHTPEEVAAMVARSSRWVRLIRNAATIRASLPPELQAQILTVPSTELPSAAATGPEHYAEAVVELIESRKHKAEAKGGGGPEGGRARAKPLVRASVRISISDDGIASIQVKPEIGGQIGIMVEALARALEAHCAAAPNG